MLFICENVECCVVLVCGQVRYYQEGVGWCFYCLDCNIRNELMNIGMFSGFVELVQLEWVSLLYKVVVMVWLLDDG